jgi:nitroreductase
MSDLSARTLSVLQRAVNAPSGDNAQPWRFRIHDDSIEVCNADNADPTLYNFRERGSYIALGAVAENIRILASEIGFAAGIKIFPDGKEGCVVRITLSSEAAGTDPLVASIDTRATNRTVYARRPLTADITEALVAAARDVGGSLRIVETDADMDTLANAVSTNERLLMEHRGLHDALFSMIRFSRKAEKATPGMYIKTMDLPPPVEIMFRSVLRSWNMLRLMNRIGFSRAIPKQTCRVYRASSAFCALALAGESDGDFVSIGRALQRVWLTATSLGLSMQPTAAIPYLAQRVRAGEADMFSPEHISLIERAYADIEQTFRLSAGEGIGMMFRIGYADAPGTASYKAPPIILA